MLLRSQSLLRLISVLIRPRRPVDAAMELQAAIGGWHCLALSEEGQVYAWGGNEYNQCGLQVSCRFA